MTRVVPVALADRSYEVMVGDGIRHELGRVIAEVVPSARRAVVVTQEGIGIDVDPGLPVDVVTVPDGESAKSLAQVEELCRLFSRSGLSRADVVVAVGGGVVTDLTGFAAATFQRGTAYVNVATSLLAQVDAAIGGKTGVNIPEGKNLVGTFWQPSAVLCDTGTLVSLPPREWASGRGEVAKYGLLGIETGFGGAPTADLPIDELVVRCAAIKADVVVSDEREGDRRMLLNYGHTLAHALEGSAFGDDGTDLRHGEAVAIGLVFAIWYFLYRTPTGLRLRAVGEYAPAAEAAGVSPARLRAAALVASGCLAGLGGAQLAMYNYVGFTRDMTAGRGFIALGAVLLGARHPYGTALAALLFGAFEALAASLPAIYTTLPAELVHSIPFVATIIALIAYARRAQSRGRRSLQRAAARHEEARAAAPTVLPGDP